MTILPITSLFAAGFALALVALSIAISLRRVKLGVMIGQSEDEVLRNRIRAHGNFVEYVPLGLIILGLVEAHGISIAAVLSAGAALALGRVLHAIGMLRPSDAVRGLGMALTYLWLISSALVIGGSVVFF